MTDLRVVGCDPGPIPGLVLLDYTETSTFSETGPVLGLERAEAMQCSAGLLAEVLEDLIDNGTEVQNNNRRILVQVERYVTGNRSSRSLVPKAGAVTRELVNVVQRVCGFADVPCYARSASEVKPWATAGDNARLAASRLLEPTKGMVHARSASWHALFCAVHDGGVPDPLSKRAST